MMYIMSEPDTLVKAGHYPDKVPDDIRTHLEGLGKATDYVAKQFLSVPT